MAFVFLVRTARSLWRPFFATGLKNNDEQVPATLFLYIGVLYIDSVGTSECVSFSKAAR